MAETNKTTKLDGAEHSARGEKEEKVDIEAKKTAKVKRSPRLPKGLPKNEKQETNTKGGTKK